MGHRDRSARRTRSPQGAGTTLPAGWTLDFTGGVLPADTTFTRASSGTRFNSSAVLVTETTNVARFEYSYTSPGTIRGLLVEPAATNFALHTATTDLNNFKAVGPVSLTLTGSTAPDGSASGNGVFSGAPEACYRDAIAAQGAALVLGSVWVKKISGAATRFEITDPDAGASHGGFSTSIFPTASWARYQCHATQTQSAGTGLGRTGFFNLTTALTVDIAFIQYEIEPSDGLGPTSFTPTTTVAVTRAQDVVTIAATRMAGISSVTCTFDDVADQILATTPGVDLVLTAANLNGRLLRTIVSN